jgi:hypothetical protein
MRPILYRSLLIAAALSLALAGPSPRAAPPPPVRVFAALDGRWSGTFVGYDPAGKELYRIAVEQTYETLDETTQRVTLMDHLPDGKVVKGTGRNVATLKKDGMLELRCIVEKSNGERVEHTGRVVRAADGEEALVWSSQAPGKSETFLEAVRRRGHEAVYTIQGMGNYGGSLVLMSGRYRRVGDAK